MSTDLWIIEARNRNGELEFRTLQPQHIFGRDSITGMSEDAIAKVIYRHDPLAPPLDGSDIPNWPKRLHPMWVARRKTW